MLTVDRECLFLICIRAWWNLNCLYLSRKYLAKGASTIYTFPPSIHLKNCKSRSHVLIYEFKVQNDGWTQKAIEQLRSKPYKKIPKSSQKDLPFRVYYPRFGGIGWLAIQPSEHLIPKLADAKIPNWSQRAKFQITKGGGAVHCYGDAVGDCFQAHCLRPLPTCTILVSAIVIAAHHIPDGLLSPCHRHYFRELWTPRRKRDPIVCTNVG